MSGYAWDLSGTDRPKASMTLDVYADLFDDDLDVVADRLDAANISLANL